VSVLETIIGKRKPNFESYNAILDLLQKFMIECKSQATTRKYKPECIRVLDAYLQRQGLSEKQSLMEARIITEQAKDPNMQWGIEIGYNSAMYWHKDKNADAPKGLDRLLKTTR